MINIGANIDKFMNVVDGLLVRFAQCLLALMVIITFFSVIGRTFFNVSIPDDLLIAEMLMVVIVFLPLSWVQSIGAHLEVTVLTDFFPERVQDILGSIGLILGVLMFGGMSYLSFISAYEAHIFDELAYNSVLDLREWPVKYVLSFGLGWWCVRMMVQLLWPSTRSEADTEFKSALEDTAYLTEKNKG